MATTTGRTIFGPFYELDFTKLVTGGINLPTYQYDLNTRTLTVRASGLYETITLIDPGTTVFRADKDFMGGTTIFGVGTSNYVINDQPRSDPTVCFTSGTLIRTAHYGIEVDVAVEALRIGDVVVTASGTHRAICWIGSRRIALRRHPRAEEVMPVRIHAHAFGHGLPSRDLRVSPGHALCFDLCGEVLIPALALVNGTTVVQEEAEHVTYWHVELDSHDILLAESLPAESYLDMGNRGFFAEATVSELAARSDTLPRGHAGFCRPFHSVGPIVEALRARLAARANALQFAPLKQQTSAA